MANRTNLKRVTLADVARSAGVSQTAALFVLSGRREEMRISLDVEARVLGPSVRPATNPHRLTEPPHWSDSDDRLRLGHGRDDAFRRTPHLGSTRRRSRARPSPIHRRNRGGPGSRAAADRGDARPPCRRDRLPRYVHAEDGVPPGAPRWPCRPPQRAAQRAFAYPLRRSRRRRKLGERPRGCSSMRASGAGFTWSAQG